MQDSQGQMEAADSVEGTEDVELWVSGAKLFHVEQWGRLPVRETTISISREPDGNSIRG